MLFGLGIIGEYIGRIFEQVRSRPRFVVAEVIGDDFVTGSQRQRGADRAMSASSATTAVVFGYGDIGVRVHTRPAVPGR